MHRNRVNEFLDDHNVSSRALARNKVTTSLEERLYATTDVNHNVTSIDDVFGAAQERLVYDPYRQSTVLSAAWASTADLLAWSTRSQGEREDATTNTIDGRSRLYEIGMGRWMQADFAGYIDGANRYQFAISSPVTHTDPSGNLIVGFYGADINNPFNSPNGNSVAAVGYLDGNKLMTKIKAEVGAEIFGSNSDLRAISWLFTQLDTNKDGKYDPNHGDKEQEIKIFGHSWGGYSAIELAKMIKDDNDFCDKKISVLAVVDPVNTLRGRFDTVPDNVSVFWNRYQTGNKDVNILGLLHPRGQAVPSEASISDQKDLNASGKETFDFPGLKPVVITHWSILAAVKDELVGILENDPT